MNLSVMEAIEINMEGIELVFCPRKQVDQVVFDELMIYLMEKKLGDLAEEYLKDVKMGFYYYFDASFESIFNAEDVQQFFFESAELQKVVENVAEWIAEDLKMNLAVEEVLNESKVVQPLNHDENPSVSMDFQSEQLTLF
ncbi:hypothetical protein AB3N04_00975 (plasmid) [Alkalihalophilus sp. As8PL]|uniref:Uncharacterized protein n=1 Tax=Alkalihalophilus sp. As8PL TaxID=3237103 RepID=A0AB39BMQ7_9BACI